MNDTKAYWKRRAIKAEHELESIQRVRSFEHGQEFSLSRANAVLITALREIEDAIAWAKSNDTTLGK